MERVASKLKLDVWATLVAGGVLSALSFVAADALVRQWQYIPVARHVVGSIALYTLAGAVLGLCAGALLELEHFLTSRVARKHPRLGAALRPLFYALLAVWACHQTAQWTFSGMRMQQTPLARWGPRAFLILIAIAVAAGAWLVIRSRAALDAGRYKLALAVGISFVLASAFFVTIDLTAFVALYVRLHTLLETAAALLSASALVLLLTGLAQRFDGVRRAIRAGAAVALAWSLMVAGISPLRGWLDSALRHVWLEEVYVGRVLRRYQTVDAFLHNPWHWRGLAMSRVERLRERYDVTNTAEDKSWQALPDEPADFAARIRDLRGERTDFNIIIYYVDTLRSDYATNPKTMPATVSFSKRAINFRQAYSAGSDTLRALPALTGGNYRFGAPHRNDLLEVAKRSELVSVLFIAQSAHEFLTKLRPSFKFEQTVRIQDYAPERTDVWGYGASAPTAGRIVDGALGWLRSRGSPKHRFMLWLFNFDQHNWRELDESYIATAANKYGLSEEGDPSFRYRVTARAIDAEFERLLHGIDQLGLSERTIVVFVSDHGEALGRDGFWVHSVFLWEPLVRVPLAIRIPGIPPQEIDETVSLVDVAPTLARYIESNPPSDGYQGEDLLGYLVPGRPPRRLPLLMAAVAKEQLVRIGMIHPESPYKLVLSLEAAVPELYDLSADDVDSVNVAEREPRRLLGMLNALARSPVFPRTADDFGVEPDDSVAPLP